jgi:hypothetical protein
MTTLFKSLQTLTDDNIAIDSAASAPLDPVHWTQLNPRLVEGQFNDRSPVSNSVTPVAGSIAARRSSTRRSHQINFKEWSKGRHD